VTGRRWRPTPASTYFRAMRRDPRNSHHLATISHDGRFWDAYLELEEDPGRAPTRGRIAFSAAGGEEGDPVRTTTIFIEDSAQDVLARARDFKAHHLLSLLRSALPSPAGAEEGERGPGEDESG
jgi:hypothetical protein